MLSTSRSSSESSIQEAESPTYGSIIPAIKRCKSYQILACGVNHPSYKPKQKTDHLCLLSGIVGKEIPHRTCASFSFEMNKVQVKIHFGTHPECEITDIDLLIFFFPISNEMVHHLCAEQIDAISRKRGDKIWKHSIVILTGVDMTKEELMKNDSLLERCTIQVQKAAKPYSKCMVKVSLAGRQEQPCNPFKSNEKWFSKLWLSCFLSSKIKSMPAILKIAQGRIKNKIESKSLLNVAFCKQPIEVQENSVELPKSLKTGLGVGGSGAIAGAAAAGATTGALIGALAIGIPSFGVAAGAGLALGGVVGGGIGAGIAGAAVGGAYQLAKEKQLEVIDTADLRKYYNELLSRIPKMCEFLNNWAEKQINCKMVVAGIEGEDVSKTAAALIEKAPRRGGSGLYWKQVISMKTNLIVQDFSCISSKNDRRDHVQALVEYQKKTHLLIFCIPITMPKEEFAESAHADYLEQLHKADSNVFRNMVIVLTRADELQNEIKRHSMSIPISFQQYFNKEVNGWKEQIKHFFDSIHNCFIKRMPIIPVGSVSPSIDLSDHNSSSATQVQYHWLSELLLHAMPATKVDGLPALITINNKRMQDLRSHYSDPEPDNNTDPLEHIGEINPRQSFEQAWVEVPVMGQDQHDEIAPDEAAMEKVEPEKGHTAEAIPQDKNHQVLLDPEKAPNTSHHLIVKAQCLMFSQIGLREKRHPGEAIGHIFGVRNEQNWLS